MTSFNYALHNNTSNTQLSAREKLYKLFEERPFEDPILLTNMGLFTRASALAKVFFLYEAYTMAMETPGDIFVLGTWLGQDLVVFESMRAMLEPYNCSRRYVGFDTFEGYQELGKADARSETMKEGGYSVSQNYEQYLAELLAYHRSENAMGHAVKHELIKGDVRETMPKYFSDHPESIVALAYFDMALQKPTEAALAALNDRLVIGSVLCFDEINDARYPGESIAVREWLKGKNYTIKRSKFLPDRTFVTIQG
jgi:hypothetical protein